MALTYQIITAAEQLAVVEEALRARELDHLRVAVVAPNDPRLADWEDHIKALQADRKTLKTKADKEG